MRAIVLAAILVVVSSHPNLASQSEGENRGEQIPSTPGELNSNPEARNNLPKSGEGLSDSDFSDDEIGLSYKKSVHPHGTLQFPNPGGENLALTYVAKTDGCYHPHPHTHPEHGELPRKIPQFVLHQVAKSAEDRKQVAGSSEKKSKRESS